MKQINNIGHLTSLVVRNDVLFFKRLAWNKYVPVSVEFLIDEKNRKYMNHLLRKNMLYYTSI